MAHYNMVWYSMALCPIMWYGMIYCTIVAILQFRGAAGCLHFEHKYEFSYNNFSYKVLKPEKKRL